MPIPWKAVCCPVDLSEESRAALRVAADLCRILGATLTLLHVDEGDGASGQLSAWRLDAEAAGAPVVSVEETRGDPDTAIAEFADRRGIDLIVMGTHGRTGREHSLVGSVAASTVRQARCPVMVVHPQWSGLR
jgi:universal stress protein A